MTTQVPDLRMYKDKEGSLFYCDGGSDCQTAAGESVAEIISRLNPVTVRLYGAASQADLILSALNCDSRVMIGSPSELRKKCSPAEALQRMTVLYSLRPYFGGWRDVDEKDRATFTFLSVDPAEKPELAVQLLERHPANPVLLFLCSAIPEAISFLHDVEDPRWFHRDINHPERESPLRMYLGVIPSNVKAAAESKPITGHHKQRFTNLMRVLFGPIVKDSLAGGVLNAKKTPASQIFTQLRGSGPVLPALQKTVDMLVSFIRQAWLQELSPPGREAFVPEYFFQSLGRTGKVLAGAYKKVVARCHTTGGSQTVFDTKI